jgi:predicted DNA-binding transcriptional regulator AlpA
VRDKVQIKNLVGSGDIAQRLGLKSAGVVRVLRKRHADFPKPITKVNSVYVWDWRSVKKWSESRNRKKRKR